MRKTMTIRGIDLDAHEMLLELREAERRQTGAIVGDALRHYFDYVFEGAEDEKE